MVQKVSCNFHWQNYCLSLIIVQKVLILTITIIQGVDVHSNAMQTE